MFIFLATGSPVRGKIFIENNENKINPFRDEISI